MQNAELGFRIANAKNSFTTLRFAHKEERSALKNTLVWMLADGKEKAQGVAVVDLLRPAGLFYFSMLVAKITRFN